LSVSAKPRGQLRGGNKKVAISFDRLSRRPADSYLQTMSAMSGLACECVLDPRSAADGSR
jgi:hypothetical protein